VCAVIHTDTKPVDEFTPEPAGNERQRDCDEPKHKRT
jgi:hypothetical protein